MCRRACPEGLEPRTGLWWMGRGGVGGSLDPRLPCVCMGTPSAPPDSLRSERPETGSVLANHWELLGESFNLWRLGLLVCKMGTKRSNYRLAVRSK